MNDLAGRLVTALVGNLRAMRFPRHEDAYDVIAFLREEADRIEEDMIGPRDSGVLRMQQAAPAYSHGWD